MTEEEFEVGIKQVEAALQGAFDPKFVGYLWEYFSRHHAEAWANICATLCQSTKSARNLVFHDFLQVGITLRGRSHERRKLEQSREPRDGDITKLDIVGMAEKMAKKTGLSAHKKIAVELRRRQDEASAK